MSFVYVLLNWETVKTSNSFSLLPFRKLSLGEPNHNCVKLQRIARQTPDLWDFRKSLALKSTNQSPENLQNFLFKRLFYYASIIYTLNLRNAPQGLFKYHVSRGGRTAFIFYYLT